VSEESWTFLRWLHVLWPPPTSVAARDHPRLQWPDFLHWRLESELDIQGVQACNHAWTCREICSWNLEMASLQLQAIKRSKMITALGAMLWIWGCKWGGKSGLTTGFHFFPGCDCTHEWQYGSVRDFNETTYSFGDNLRKQEVSLCLVQVEHDRISRTCLPQIMQVLGGTTLPSANRFSCTLFTLVCVCVCDTFS
jgi:hypothetical protein